MNRELLARLRADLELANYRSAAITALWGQAAEGARVRGVFLPAQRALATRETGALGTLARVFLLGESASASALDAALPTLGHLGAVTLGLVVPAAADPHYIAALSLNTVQLAPATATTLPTNDGADTAPGEWWMLSDLDDQLRRGPARPDHVMGVGGATRTLLAQIEQAPVANALDLGTGCGAVAMFLAALGADRVVATDISARALTLAAANAELNGFESRIEFREGDLFAPIAGERFDLIVSNPPFVITPRSDNETERYEYRDGGMTGDELAAKVVSEAPIHLAEGGSLVCLANWETPWGGDGLDRVSEWIELGAAACGSGLDAWVIERDRVDTVQYAETWARDGGARPGHPEFDKMLGSWLGDFAARGIVSVGLGSIRVRRGAAVPQGPDDAAARTVIRAEQAMGVIGGGGSAFASALRAGAHAERTDDAEVLATRWIRAAGVIEEREHTPGEEAPRAIQLVIASPIGRRVGVDPLLAGAVGACDGELTLGQLAAALAEIFEVDSADTAAELVAGVRELAWLGMLTPGA